MYNDWDNQPVVTNVATTGLEISQVLFPSVTICADGVMSSFSHASFIKQLSEFVQQQSKNNVTITFSPFKMASAIRKTINGKVI